MSQTPSHVPMKVWFSDREAALEETRRLLREGVICHGFLGPEETILRVDRSQSDRPVLEEVMVSCLWTVALSEIAGLSQSLPLRHEGRVYALAWPLAGFDSETNRDFQESLKDRALLSSGSYGAA